MRRLAGLVAVLVLPIVAGCAADGEPIPRYMLDAPRTNEDVRRALAEISRELGPTFIVDDVDGLFYLATNGGMQTYRACRATVERMFGFLTRDFFERRPKKPIRIYCFNDASSYERYCKMAYDQDAPTTPYGFYIPRERKIVLNVDTGLGTLSHELVHPLLAEDFPNVPTWFNEGFASLYEETATTADGMEVGRVNWRLPGLRDAIREGRGIALSALLSTTSTEFYGDRRVLHYAAARYLCKWLQDRQLLREFYVTFRANAETDPTGRATLEKVTRLELDELDRIWRRWLRTQR